MNFAKLALASVALLATPALANDQVTTGATVTGPEGNTVGTIVSVENGQAVLDTGKHKVPLGIDMYGVGEAGPTITVTKAQLDGMVDAQLAETAAKLDAALVAGASAMDVQHAPLGTIMSVEGDAVLVARGGDEANQVSLLREHFTVMDGHGLMSLLSNAQIDAAMAQAAATTNADGAGQ